MIYSTSITVKECGKSTLYRNLVDAVSASEAREDIRTVYLLPANYPVKVTKHEEPTKKSSH